MVLLVSAATALVYVFASDSRTGHAEATDGVGLAVAFLLIGLLTDALPALWRASRRRRVEPFVMPVYMTLSLAYAYFAFKTGFLQPGATALAVTAHVVTFAYLSLRSS